jgi:succinyl-diaminopimelate desuccinylase
MPKDCLQPDTNYLLQVLKDIIGFKTVAPPGSCYREIVDYLVPILSGLGFETKKLVMPQEVFAARCGCGGGRSFNLRGS